MKFLLVFALLIIVTTIDCLAQSVGAQDVEMQLEQMTKSGKISPEQAKVTREYMKKLNPDDWKMIEAKARDCIHRKPASVDKLNDKKTGKIDLSMCE